MGWNLTKEAAERISNSHLLSILDQDVSEISEEDTKYLEWQVTTFKETLLQAVPARFHPYIEDGSLNKPTLAKAVREDYLAWVQEEEHDFRQLLDAADCCSKKALAFCSEPVQDIFSQSLHDSQIWKIERANGNVSITVKCDCFTSMEVVVLIFENVLRESLEAGLHIIYHELQKTNEGFAFRMICENNMEWTIEAEALHARSYYYPVTYGHLYNEGVLQNTTIEQYIEKLNPNLHYTLISQDIEIPITQLLDQAPYIKLATGEVQISEKGIYVIIDNNHYRLGDSKEALITFIYTDIFEDPFEIQRTPLAEEEIEDAILGENAILQVRAWYTLQENPLQFSTTINNIFRRIEHTDHTHMTLYIYVNFFYKASVLQDDVIEKFIELIEPLE